ncbi:methyltransferase domain-containing protein [Tateyamaria pelophila]|uniref:methyltransferase domain-containing protein n=1 Tax=Tateyamaria pelophila TaxID=328415 RepID=UPI001CBD1C1E|nr:class I SAM-dependent methyltransferase [Tateyamaria pelophila]
MSPSGYSLNSYGEMITCEPRQGEYAKALKQAITPGCRVIDLGAGPGHFALLACKYGAGHVVVIEPDPSIHIAKLAAQDNGFADRITFVRDMSQNWSTDEKADVVISDIRGVIPLFEHHIPTIKDVRKRLLKHGGVQIPGVDHIYGALVEAPEVYTKHVGPWLDKPYGLDMSAAHIYVANRWSRTYMQPEALISSTQRFATLDYRTIEDTNHRASLTFEATRTGTTHGILIWFETELLPGVGYSNAPGAPEQIYGQAFFPFERPVSLAEGMTATADISANFIDGSYVWSWNFRATDTDGQAQAFRQSSFKADIISPETLAPRAASFCPPQHIKQKIDVFCLSLFDGQTDLNTVADQLSAKFPQQFETKSKALNHVAKLSARYN